MEATILTFQGERMFTSVAAFSFEHVGLDVITAVLVKSTIILHVTWYSPSEIHRRFEGTYCLLDSEDGGDTF